LAHLILGERCLSRGDFVGVLPLACIAIWFDVRPAKWIVVGYLSIATLGAGILLLKNGFSVKLVMRGLASVCGAIQFATWNGGPRSKPPTIDRSFLDD